MCVFVPPILLIKTPCMAGWLGLYPQNSAVKFPHMGWVIPVKPRIKQQRYPEGNEIRQPTIMFTFLYVCIYIYMYI